MTNFRASLLPLFLLCTAEAGLYDRECPLHDCSKASQGSLDDSVSLMQLSKMSVNRMKESAQPSDLKETVAAKVLKLAAESVTKKDAEAAAESMTKQDPKGRIEAKSVEEVLRLAAGGTEQAQFPLPAAAPQFPLPAAAPQFPLPAAAPCVTTPGPLNIPGMPPWVHPTAGMPIISPLEASPCDQTVQPFPAMMTPPLTAVPCMTSTAMPCAPTTQPCPTLKPPTCFSEGLPGDMKNFKFEATRMSALYAARDYYHYTMYIGGRIEQRRVGYPDFFYNLGEHSEYNGMTEEFTNGDTDGCDDGVARSATVHYQQGPPGAGNLMLWDGEVSQCHYEFFIQIDPNLCHPGLKKINVIVGYNVLPPEQTPCGTTTGMPCGVTEPAGPPLGNLTIVVPPPLHVPAAGQVAIPAQVPEYTLVPLTTTPPYAGQQLVPAQVPETVMVPTLVPVTPVPMEQLVPIPVAAASPCATAVVPGVFPGAPPVAPFVQASPFGGR